MLKVFLRFQPAAGQEGIGDTDGGGVSELHPDVELIIPFQKGTVNDVENVSLVFLPVFRGKLGGNPFQLLDKALFAGNLKAVFQCLRHYFLVFLRAVFPEEGAAGVCPLAGVGNVKDIL